MKWNVQYEETHHETSKYDLPSILLHLPVGGGYTSKIYPSLNGGIPKTPQNDHFS